MSEQKYQPLNRIHIVPLYRAYEAPPYRRAKVAIRLIKEFAKRHMKATEVKISEEVNLSVWSRGIRKPPRRLKLEMVRDEDGIVEVKLPSEEEKVS
jgi:large subunit ribosomal protein L31e